MVELSFIDSNIIVFANVKDFPEYNYSLTVLENGLKGNLYLCFNTIIALETHYKLTKLINIEAKQILWISAATFKKGLMPKVMPIMTTSAMAALE